MSDLDPIESESPPHAETATPKPPPPGYAFWGYSDLFLFLGLALPSVMAGALLVHGLVALLHLTPRHKVMEILPAQFAGYALLFAVLYGLFRFQHGQPFWRSLGWVSSGVSAARAVFTGVTMAFLVAIASAALRTPDINTPMKELLQDRTSAILVAAFGTTLGPLCEELAFRGFMQPLFVRTLGVLPGILLAAVPFGLLHLQQYAFSWRHALLITLAGAGFGWMRYASGSTKAATIMHAAYNSTFFLALVLQWKDLPNTW